MMFADTAPAEVTANASYYRVAPNALAVFTGQLKAGDMAGAMGSLKQLDPDAAREMMFRAGFSIRDNSGPKFWAKAQADIVKACRAKQDGYELRGDGEVIPAIARAA